MQSDPEFTNQRTSWDHHLWAKVGKVVQQQLPIITFQMYADARFFLEREIWKNKTPTTLHH